MSLRKADDKTAISKGENDMTRMIITVKPAFVAATGKGWAPFVMRRLLIDSGETNIA